MCIHKNVCGQVEEMRERYSEFIVHWMSVMRFDIRAAAQYLNVTEDVIRSLVESRYDGTLDDYIALIERCGYRMEFKFLHI